MSEKLFCITLNLNARLLPLDREPLDDTLDKILKKLKIGKTDGGGTLVSKGGEIINCDIELSINKRSFDGDIIKAMDKLSQIVDVLGVPKESKLICGDIIRSVGRLEGLAFYANGTELPAEVYQNCDINYVIEQMEKCMDGVGRFYSYWQGPTETALYFYGASYEQMKSGIEKFVSEYPLCQKSRIVRIA